jgi:hypothetical protein
MLDPDRIQPKMLDPDEMNADPQPWLMRIPNADRGLFDRMSPKPLRIRKEFTLKKLFITSETSINLLVLVG